MKSLWPHRLALLLALLVLAVIIFGASLTSEIRPLPGSETPAAVTLASAPGLESLHRVGGYVVVALTLLLAILASSVVTWLALALSVLDGLLGGFPVLHAFLAPAFFSSLAAAALMTSNQWNTESRPEPSPWAPLRSLAIAVPVLVFIQTGLGAAFRHNAMGVISHILNALIVLGVVLVAGVFVLRQYPEHPGLRSSALALLIIAGVQVLLGFSVYLVLLMSSENNPALIITGVLHVANGSMTLATAVIFALQVIRNIEVTNRSVTAT